MQKATQPLEDWRALQLEVPLQTDLMVLGS